MKNLFQDELILKESILVTLAWFSIMERPLKFHEIKEYLWRYKVNDKDLTDELDELYLAKKITIKAYKDDTVYYFLYDDNGIVERYADKISIQKKLIQKAKKASVFLRFVPFLKKIYICNSLALGKANESSDIDLFIVTGNSRMFLSRSIITFILSILKMRRYGENIKQKICLSFFTEVDNLDLKKIALDDDVYLIYWIATLKLLYGSKYSNVTKKENKWIHKYLQNLNTKEERAIYKYPFIFSFVFKWLFELILRGLLLAPLINKIAGYFQKIRANKKLQLLGNKAKNIVSDNMLKFHDKDRREYYKDMWVKRLKKVL